MVKRIAVVFQRFGPYHAARLEGAVRAAAPHGAEVVGIEVAAKDAVYGWAPVPAKGGLRRVTLFSGAYEERSGRAIRAALERALDAEQPDAVALPGWAFPEARAGLAWCGRRARGAVLMSESSRGDFARCWWKEWMKRRIVRRFGAALVGGRVHADYAVELGVPASRVYLGYDVVDNEYFATGAARAREQAGDLRARHGLPAAYFLCSCRFVQKKNVAALVDAYARYALAAGESAWGLVLCGDGPLGGALRAQVDRAGLSGRVLFAGFVQYPDLPVFYGLAGAFVLPSAIEQWGLVVNEAMACGLPVLVSSHCGCAGELVRDGVNGFVFDPRKPEQLAGLLTRVAGDDSGRRAMGEASAARIREWSPDRFGEGLWRAAEAAVGGGRCA